MALATGTFDARPYCKCCYSFRDGSFVTSPNPLSSISFVIVIRLRIFMQICVLENIIKRANARQKTVLSIVYYTPLYSVDILYIFHVIYNFVFLNFL